MTTPYVALGPLPCHRCHRPVVWVRLAVGLRLYGVTRQRNRHRGLAPHGCR